MYQPNLMAGVRGTLAKRAKSAHAFTTLCYAALLLLATIHASSLRAQTGSTWLELSKFAWENAAPNVTLNTGDTVEIAFSLGTSSNEASEVLGVDIDVTLSPDAQCPSSVTMDTTGSWLFDDGNATISATSDCSEDLLNFLGERSDGTSRTGYGTVFRFILVSDEDGIQASELIQESGGHVLVENIEMRPGKKLEWAVGMDMRVIKRAARIAAEEVAEDLLRPLIYPNPTADKVTIDLSAYPAGLYHVAVIHPSGKKQSAKVVKQ